MDPSLFGGLSAILGSLVGGGASIATAWFTQRAQSQRELVHSEIRKRELVYTEFIAECSKLVSDSLDRTLDNPSVLVQVYALINRIRLTSTEQVVRAAEKSMRAIVDLYFQPKLSITELRAKAPTMPDPMQEFSEACRGELRDLLRKA
jgi:hypothetical protein